MTFNNKMHERNIYRNRPDFAQIAVDFPLFRKYAIPNAKGKVYVDFSNTDALRMLTEILLRKDFNLNVEIPEGFLIPTIPQRLNYILWIEDLLANASLKSESPAGIDIGTGPCAIFSLLGAQRNGWNFIATESSDDAICWANKNIAKNDLTSKISIVKVSQGSALSEILSANETCFEFCLCNPPFYENPEEVRKKHPKSSETIADIAQVEEIFFKGGEVEFVRNILRDSITFKKRICLFTSMFGKKNSFLQILKEIKEIKDAKVTTTEFCQGNTVRWGIAWTFDQSVQLEEIKKKAKPKKAKPPLEYSIPIISKLIEKTILGQLLEKVQQILKELEIPNITIKSSKNFAELLLKSDKNTWTNQRRKRREHQRQIKDIKSSEKDFDGKRPFSSSESATLLTLCDKDHNITSGENISTVSNSSILSENSLKMLEDDEKLNAKGYNLKVKTVTEKDAEILSAKIILQSSKPLLNSESPAVTNSETFESNADEKHLIERENKYNDNDRDYKIQSIKKEKYSDSPVLNKPAFNKVEMTEVKTEKSCNDDQNASDSNVSLHMKRKEDFSHDYLLPHKKTKLEQVDCIGESSIYLDKKEKEEFSHEDLFHLKNITERKEHLEMNQGTVLHCHLQLIKGRSKVYVKMNCPTSADRNSMHQVFLLIKNKLK